MQKVLILTVTAGTGHNAVANALKQKLTEQNKIVKVVDIFKEYDEKLKAFLMDNGYFLISTLMPSIYNMFFYGYANANPNHRYSGMTQDFLKSITPKVLKTIYSFKPDIILCSHFYPPIVVTNLKNAFPIDAKVVAFITDYVVHPFWESSIGLDYVVTPSECLTDNLLYKGFKKKQIKPLGYPILQKFTKHIDKHDALKQLNLKDDVLTVCVTCGGNGSAKMPDIIKKLLKVKYPLQIIAINGNNKLSKQKVDKLAQLESTQKANKTILSYGFTNEIDLIFAASDIMVSKGGCTFINEAMSKTLPQIFIKNLPAQEQYNAEYLKQNGAGLIATKEYDVDKIVNTICANPQIIEDLKQNIIKIRKPNALNDITNFICSINHKANYSEPESKISALKVINKVKKANNKIKHLSVIPKNEIQTHKTIEKIQKSSKHGKNKIFRSIDKKVI